MWSSLTGALAIPATVSHNGLIYMLLANAADVTAITPGVSSQWLLVGTPLVRLPILQANAGFEPVSCGESITGGLYSPGFTMSGSIAYGNALYVISASAASANVASSADCKTWILRTMPASKAWVLGSSGSVFLGVVASDTAVAVSSGGTAGTSWSAATALPGGLAGVMPPIKLGSRWIVAGTSTTYYTSDDDGATWATRTFPAAPSALRLVGTTAWIRTGTTTAYTSTDGAAWTSRTIANYTNVTVDSDGSLLGSTTSVAAIERSTDGIAWSATQRVPNLSPNAPYVTVNGVKIFGFGETSGGLYTDHGTGWYRRGNLDSISTVTGSGQASIHAAIGRGVLGGRFVACDVAASTLVGLIEPSAAIKGLFAAV